MGRFDILDSGVPYSMYKTKNYVKLEDGSVEEIVDLSDLETTEVGFIGHKANDICQAQWIIDALFSKYNLGINKDIIIKDIENILSL